MKKTLVAFSLLWTLFLFLICASIQAHGASGGSSINFLQQEQVSCGRAQQSILQYLKQHKIPIGSEPQSLKNSEKQEDRIENRVITSTEEAPVECRISLGNAPPGTKCVAPCGCLGSQKWVQFSVLNKLRRKDPQQWTTCPTCREDFKYSLFSHYGGVKAAVLGLLLEKRMIIRAFLLLLFLSISSVLSLSAWMSRVLVSRTVWQMYPKLWIRLTRLPLPFKFWGGKVLLSTLWEKYQGFEKNVIVNFLADLETQFIEDNLPDSRDFPY